LGPVPLQIIAVLGVVTTGFGFTVTVMVKGVPGQEPDVEVGVTIYCTVPAVVLSGLISVWLIVDPEPALAPVMPPAIVPIVHVNVLATLAAKAMFVPVPLQIVFVVAVVTVGAGFTVTINVAGVPVHPFADGVIVIVAVIGVVVALVATNEGMSPDPLSASPMAGLSFVQVNVVPLTVPDKFVIGAIAPEQYAWLFTELTVAVG
jgi:hypothetical protein